MFDNRVRWKICGNKRGDITEAGGNSVMKCFVETA
jgi:hypothetical protein